jgi:hypothetical protein
MTNLTETFWLAFITAMISCFLTIVRTIYKSKCKSCSFCGLKIERDVELETEIDELAIQRSSALGNNSVKAEN